MIRLLRLLPIDRGCKPWIRSQRLHGWAAPGLALWLAAMPAGAAQFSDPLDNPAQIRSAVATRPFQSVARAGEHLVAVGSRGMIAVSGDQGRTWKQSQVPVQSDLLAVHFPTPTSGWAVGHDGVVLHSMDAGTSWTKQLDGRTAAETFKRYYQAQAQAGDRTAGKALATIEQNFRAGFSLPYLDVWFENADRGYAVGSFGMIIATRDRGRTWEPWLHRIDNEQQLNLNTVRGFQNNILVAGERGQVFRFDRAKERFTAVDSGYTGSFFGLAGNRDAILAFGLRGVIYRSADHGRSWAPVKAPSAAAIAAGEMLPDGSGFVLVSAAGQIILTNSAGTEFRLVQAAQPMRFTGVVPLQSRAVVLTGLAGIVTQSLSPVQP